MPSFSALLLNLYFFLPIQKYYIVSDLKYKRVLLKLSGEALMGTQNYGIDPQVLAQYAEDVREAYQQGMEIAIVIGGGNIYRGMNEDQTGIERAQVTIWVC